MICERSGKECHSRDGANRKLRELADDPRDAERDKLNIYRCRDCRRWHAGHKYGATKRNPNLA